MPVRTSLNISTYGKDNLEDCPWPQTGDGEYARKFITPLLKEGVNHYIDNVRTNLQVLILDDLVIPMTINQEECRNSYVCSPYSFFVSYAQESLDAIVPGWPKFWLNHLLKGVGKTFKKFQFDKVVLVNNWFFSTNLYPSLNSDQVKRIVEFLQFSFPEHAIVFRTIDPITNPMCYHTLQGLDCEYIATRQVFLIDPLRSTLFESRIFKSDLKLLEKSGYEVIDNRELSEKDIPRLLKLYNDLYIDKYSTLNPKFNASFLQLALKEGLLNFKALKKEGRIDGIVGFVVRDGKMYCPYFGYDLSVPQEISLYRMLSTVLMLEARDRKLFFHQSSGASTFKKIRKAKGCIEYSAVFYKHLKIQRHIPWLILKNLYNSVGMIFMKRY